MIFSCIFLGIGLAQICLSFGEKAYYSVLIVWILKYFVTSFSPVLPWNDCTRWPNEICKSVDNNETSSFNLTSTFENASSAAELYWKSV